MAVSDEEFQRYQEQMLKLKERTYELESQNKKINAGQSSK
jgi:hypothetical protein